MNYSSKVIVDRAKQQDEEERETYIFLLMKLQKIENHQRKEDIDLAKERYLYLLLTIFQILIINDILYFQPVIFLGL